MTDTGKHTPGPWWTDSSRQPNLIEIVAADDWIVANVWSSAETNPMTEKDWADACLIAAAPDLLEAAKADQLEFVGLIAYLETFDPDVIVDNLPRLVASLKQKRVQVDAAIQKATVSAETKS
jgi:hypothetical protein